MQSNDADDEAATVMLFGFTKIERLGLELLCLLDTFNLSESINFDYYEP